MMPAPVAVIVQIRVVRPLAAILMLEPNQPDVWFAGAEYSRCARRRGSR